jgi:hypothetical protein
LIGGSGRATLPPGRARTRHLHRWRSCFSLAMAAAMFLYAARHAPPEVTDACDLL